MRHSRRDVQFDYLSSKQPQRPIGVPFGWLAQSLRDDPCFFVPGETLWTGRFLSFLAVECLFKAKLNDSLSNILDRFGPTSERLGDRFVRPAGAVSVGLEQDLSATHFLARSTKLLDHLT